MSRQNSGPSGFGCRSNTLAAQGSLGVLVDKLLGAGADGSAGYKGCAGRTLLQAAAVGGSKGVVSSLLRAGAQPDVNEFVDDLNVLHEGHQPYTTFTRRCTRQH